MGVLRWGGSAAATAVAVMAALCSMSCSRSATVVRLENRSPFVLTQVLLSGSGFKSVAAPDLPPGGRTEVSIASRGESGLAVAFAAGNRTVSTGQQDYFEGGGHYAGQVIISPDLSVSVEFRLLKY